jgi:hypothetical protein
MLHQLMAGEIKDEPIEVEEKRWRQGLSNDDAWKRWRQLTLQLSLEQQPDAASSWVFGAGRAGARSMIRYYSAGIKQKTSSRGHVDICICPGHYFLTFHLIASLIDWLDGAVQVGLLGGNHYEANSVLKAIVDPNSPSGEQGS